MIKLALNKFKVILSAFLINMFFATVVLARGFGGGAGFESKVTNLTNQLITVILPLVSIMGLVYAAFLMASGDEGAKKRMVLVITASVIGFLAPVVIGWFQAAVGG